MNFFHIVIIYAVAFIAFAIIHRLGKNKKPVRRAFLSFLSGFLTLIAVNITGIFTGVFLPFSMLSILVSTLGGIPGVTSLLALNLFFLV